MAWLRIDDGMMEHPKILGLTDREFRVHMNALCYTGRRRDPHVPTQALTILQGGKEAFPDTVTHDKVAGYGGGQPGCGCKWTHVTTDYVDSSGRVEAATRAKRPDLVYIPVENRYPGVR